MVIDVILHSYLELSTAPLELKLMALKPEGCVVVRRSGLTSQLMYEVDRMAFECQAESCPKTCFRILIDAAMTEGAVANVVGGCRSIVLFIEICMGGLRSRSEERHRRHLWRWAVALSQPFHGQDKACYALFKPNRGKHRWSRDYPLFDTRSGGWLNKLYRNFNKDPSE